MKKIIALLPIIFTVSSCKTSTPPPIYPFDKDNGYGVAITHAQDENKFVVAFKTKQTYFSFTNFTIGGKTTELSELKNVFSFIDSGEEIIKLNEEGYYAFEKILDERTISICYEASMSETIEESGLTIYISVNSYDFTNKYPNNSK